MKKEVKLIDLMISFFHSRPEDYEKVAPKKSYIHVDEFKGPKELAEYLHELDQDDDKYNQYFQVRCLLHSDQCNPLPFIP